MARNGFKVYCSDFLARGQNQNTSRHTAAKNEKECRKKMKMVFIAVKMMSGNNVQLKKEREK